MTDVSTSTWPKVEVREVEFFSKAKLIWCESLTNNGLSEESARLFAVNEVRTALCGNSVNISKYVSLQVSSITEIFKTISTSLGRVSVIGFSATSFGEMEFATVEVLTSVNGSSTKWCLDRTFLSKLSSVKLKREMNFFYNHLKEKETIKIYKIPMRFFSEKVRKIKAKNYLSKNELTKKKMEKLWWTRKKKY